MFRNLIRNSIIIYNNTYFEDNPALYCTVFIIAAVLGAVIRGGIALFFWHSYKLRYPDEKIYECKSKKIAFFIIYSLISVVLPLRQGMILVFIIITLILVLKEDRDIKIGEDEQKIEVT